jgi:hypothetical protein
MIKRLALAVPKLSAKRASAWGSRAIFIALLKILNTVSRRPVSSPGSGAVVSLTSYGDRVATVYMTIESIARGMVLPSRLILWLDGPEAHQKLPASIRRLESRGLEIIETSNYGPHKKYYPYVASQLEFTAALVTADDDVLYPKYWLAGLEDAARAEPSSIHCYRARKIQISHGKFGSYVDWPMCADTRTSVLTFPTGVSGVLYPPEFLPHLKARGDLFMDTCITVDDMWLHATAVRENFPAKQVYSTSTHFPVIPGTQEQCLAVDLIANQLNDKLVALTYTEGERDRLSAEAAILSSDRTSQKTAR